MNIRFLSVLLILMSTSLFGAAARSEIIKNINVLIQGTFLPTSGNSEKLDSAFPVVVTFANKGNTPRMQKRFLGDWQATCSPQQNAANILGVKELGYQEPLIILTTEPINDNLWPYNPNTPEFVYPLMALSKLKPSLPGEPITMTLHGKETQLIPTPMFYKLLKQAWGLNKDDKKIETDEKKG